MDNIIDYKYLVVQRDKLMQYDDRDDQFNLVDDVNLLIEKGYKPYGSMIQDNNGEYIQPMIHKSLKI